MDTFNSQRIKLGIFILLGTILFITGVYFIGKKQNMFGNTYDIYAVFNNVNGLKPGNNVRYSGINVGTVKEINMISDTVIVVRISIQKEITRHISTDAKCAITTDGLVGSMIINILPGTEDGQLIARGDTIYSLSRIRTDEMLQTLSETNENAALLTAEILKIAKDISAGNGLIGAIIKDPTITQDVRTIITNLKGTTQASNATISQLNKMLISLDRNDNLIGSLRDTSMAVKVKKIIVNVEKASSELNKILNQLDLTISETRNTIANAREGKGVINYLSNDPELVKKIDGTLNHLDSTIYQINKAGIQLNENLGALKKTWLVKKYLTEKEK
ncbi:MAG: MCE family protein [Saprospiraceae bacterium]|nr:MCE family protein [Saprospiraceae bacterium]MBK8819353.1 MCE family protein [Saprospiraceae bacterium]